LLAAVVGPFLGCVAGCGAGPSAPPSLAYRLPEPPEVSYAVTDTAVITIEALGQSLSLDVGSAAIYAVRFERAEEGVRVTLAVEDLSATVGVPMAGPMTFDESSVAGDLVFSLDRRGEVTVVSTPEVDEAARQLVPPEQMAHSFFPALPGTAVAAGDGWADTVAFESAQGGGQRTILEYSVVGDTLVDALSLLHVRFAGTSELTQALSMQGTQLEQRTDLDLAGHVLWDLRRGLMFERVAHMSGTGTVRTPLLPAELPTRFDMRSRARLVPP
jgi:hypothetical protein